jgi:hypothetical protein
LRTVGCALVCAVTLVAAGQLPAAAEPADVECDGQWHFEPEGVPEPDFHEIERVTLDNRENDEPFAFEYTTTTTGTQSWSHKVDLGYEVEAEASASFGIFQASLRTKLSAAYGYATEQSRTMEKGKRTELAVSPRDGYVHLVGIDTIKVKGSYERILDCEKPTQRYLRIGPVVEEAPVNNTRIHNIKLPPLKEGESSLPLPPGKKIPK